MLRSYWNWGVSGDDKHGHMETIPVTVTHAHEGGRTVHEHDNSWNEPVSLTPYGLAILEVLRQSRPDDVT